MGFTRLVVRGSGVVVGVAIGRVSVFLRGGCNGLDRVLTLLTRRGVQVVTMAMTSASRCNVLHVVIDSPRGTCGVLGNGGIDTGLASILTVIAGSYTNDFTRALSYFAGTNIDVRCVCYFSTGRGSVLVLQAGGQRTTHRIVHHRGLRCVYRDSLVGLWAAAVRIQGGQP